MQLWPRLSFAFERPHLPWGCRRDLHAVRMSRACTNSMRHQRSACAVLRRSAACVRPRPKAETRDARRERWRKRRVKSSCFVWKDLSNVIQNARGFLTKQVMRCRARLTAPLGRAQPPLSTTPYSGRATPRRSGRGGIVHQGAAFLRSNRGCCVCWCATA